MGVLHLVWYLHSAWFCPACLSICAVSGSITMELVSRTFRALESTDAAVSVDRKSSDKRCDLVGTSCCGRSELLEVESWLVVKCRPVSCLSRIEVCGDEENNVGEDPKENKERGIFEERISG